jgi:hypothetical protein
MITEQAQECLARYRHNVELAERIEVHLPEDAGWSCVIRFYAALHLITAYLIEKTNIRFQPSGAAHLDRKRVMEKCPELRDAPKKYRELKDLSESIRYDAGFTYTAQHRDASLFCLRRIVAIVEPKLQA